MSDSPIDLLTPELMDDPVRTYASLRDQAPLVRVFFPGVPTPVWLVTRHEAVQSLLSDPRFVRDQGNLPGKTSAGAIVDEMAREYGLPPESLDYMYNSMVMKDGKDHTRLKSFVAPAFSARRINALRSYVEGLADRLLPPLVAAGSADLLADFAVPLAGSTIGEIVGVDEADRPRMSSWINDFLSGDPGRIMASGLHIVEYIKDLTERRRTNPADDLVSTLVRPADNGERLRDIEVSTMILFLLNTGQNPASHFIANATMMLLDHPDQLDKFRADPALMPHVIHETLRVAGTVPIGPSVYAMEDMDFHGVQVRQGDALMPALFAANHDPKKFDHPEQYDVTRVPERVETHLSFAHGPHYCMGAALARLEAEVVLERLFLRQEPPALAVARDKVEYLQIPPGKSFMRSLPVRFR
ncbi:cytochrome P450 [Nocardia sp. CDC159]|uniref:Cytochrome P450 n=1 Tax=Nocardia pulmonis TaxID=2951408 RepID=A0A9X2E807_9NOCA|nr:MULTISPECIES: cytochrome P450 [Nocardia]MCM6773188.1 cytochrome P450 [Nocardia pulmonis]MCM6785509.1 cytochrome P450 [Nocardia sp. CDC159]